MGYRQTLKSVAGATVEEKEASTAGRTGSDEYQPSANS
jgi:hypothetical protein